MGDFNIKLPRRFRDIVGPYAHARLQNALSTKVKSIVEIMATNDLFAVNTFFRPKKRQSFHTWRRKKPSKMSQIDYIMASKRWRSCFTDSKVSWSPTKFKHGKPTDHGMVVARFRWRLRKREATRRINWQDIKPVMTLGQNPQNTNSLLDDFDLKCAALMQGNQSENPTEAMDTLNKISVDVASKVIPPAERVIAGRSRPSPQSIEFAAKRALEIESGVTPQRERELHKKMCRMRRRDYQRWHSNSVARLNKSVTERRWHEARCVENVLRGVPRQDRKMPSRGYKRDVTITSDTEATQHWKYYMQDLFARRLADRVHHESGWPEVGDVSGPGAAWSDDLFNWAIDRVHTGRAPGLNRVQVELYKYSKWTRGQLRILLKRVWETTQFPVKMITGVATPLYKKSGSINDYSRYRILVVFPAEYKIFATMFLKRILSECAKFLGDWQSAFLEGRSTADTHFVAKQLYRAICTSGESAVAVHLDYTAAFDSLSHIYLFKALKEAGASPKTLQLYKAIYTHAMVMVKANKVLVEPIRIGRGALEGDITSPMYFNVGLEAIFRHTEELNDLVLPSNGVTLRCKPVKKVGFTDDVTIMAKDADSATTKIKNTEHASEVGGLYLSRRKSYAQHIGRAKEAPAVTSADVAALNPPRQCPKPWCTRRFFTMKEVRCHVL